MLAALRGVLRGAWRLGYLSDEGLYRAIDLPPVKGERLPRGRALSAGELRALFGACAVDHSPAAARDAALLTGFYAAGLRRSKAVALDLADHDPEGGELRLRAGEASVASFSLHDLRRTFISHGF